MPHVNNAARQALHHMLIRALYYALSALGIRLTAIMLWRYSPYSLLQGTIYAETPQNRLEGNCAQRRRGAQPSSGIDLGSAVQRKCFLRPERPGASTLRNAASPSHRRPLSCCRGGSLWGFAADFLPGANRIHQGRSPRIATKTSRPQTWSQIIGR